MTVQQTVKRETGSQLWYYVEPITVFLHAMCKFTRQMGTRYRHPTKILSLSYLLLVLTTPIRYGSANDTITQSKPLSVRETLISTGQSFELGFFSPANSSNQYLGIWYKKTSVRKVVWVANRENPLKATDSSSSLIIGKDGNLRLLDGMRNPVWWTNVTSQSNNSVAVLSDNGDFILRDNISDLNLWESFDYPGDVLLPGMTLGLNTKTGEKRVLSSWKSEDDPSPGNFIGGLTPEKPPQAFIWNGSKPYWRSGPWDGGKFNGIEDSDEGYVSAIKLQSDNQQGSFYLSLDTYNSSYIIIMTLKPTGTSEITQKDGAEDLYVKWVLPANECDKYGICGPFGVCKKKSEICECFKGFVPYSAEDWREGNWTGGCVRRTELLCQKNSSSASGNHKADGFFKVEKLKLPDQSQYLFKVQDSSSCQEQCTSNCSCTAYAYVAKIGCMIWNGVLVDTQQFLSTGDEFFIRLAHSELGKDDKKDKLIISFTTISSVILIGALVYGLYRHRAIQRAASLKKHNRMKGLFSDAITEASGHTSKECAENAMHEESIELPLLEFGEVLAATNNFCRTNKLGEGGFGSVYKGKLENGQEVAVKRLSSHSGQGVQEFKNEIILISKLQHRNLVRLFGCCIEGDEKILVYEYMTNKSLDTFLFDAKRGVQLDWAKRLQIILGIARGLLYLHRDSRLRIIHRDLKASNVLLDSNMDPKISDFGLARTFQAAQETANTHRVAGTFGYMSPEYAIGGLFSEKSDVYSFGVLLLEIVSGMKNTSFYNNEKYLHLLGYAWQLWEEKRGIDLLDQAMANSCTAEEDVVRCIHIGLLCVQDHAADRPTMPTILVMLSSNIDLPQPKEPKFTFQSLLNTDLGSSNKTFSKNELTVSVVEGR